jgi:hypothetical protein
VGVEVLLDIGVQLLAVLGQAGLEPRIVGEKLQALAPGPRAIQERT